MSSANSGNPTHELKVVLVKERLAAKCSNRRVGLKKRHFFIVFDGRKVAISREQGARFLTAYRETKSSVDALGMLLENMRKSHFSLNIKEISSLNVRFDGIKSTSNGKYKTITYKFKTLLTDDNGVKIEELEDPGSLGTHKTCRRKSADRY